MSHPSLNLETYTAQIVAFADFDTPVVSQDDLPDTRHSHSCTAVMVFRCEPLLEYSVSVSFGNSRAVVFEGLC